MREASAFLNPWKRRFASWSYRSYLIHWQEYFASPLKITKSGVCDFRHLENDDSIGIVGGETI